MSKKRIAVCLFGEPRSVGTTSSYIKSFFECDDIEVDYFCHSWIKNTCRWYLGKDSIYNIELNSEEQKEEDIYGNINKVTEYLKETYNPKKILVEDYVPFIRKYSKEKSKEYGVPYAERWLKKPDEQIPDGTGQFFSTEKSINLKREYEIENNFRYDVVYRLRYDTALESSPSYSGNFYEKDTPRKDIILQKGLLTDNVILVNAFRVSDFLRPEISDHGPYIGRSEVQDRFVENLSKHVWIYYYNLKRIRAGGNVHKYKSIDQENYDKAFTEKYLYSSHVGGLIGLQFEGVWALQFVLSNMDCTRYRGIYHNLVRSGQPDSVTNVRGVNNYHAFLRFKVYTHIDLFSEETQDKKVLSEDQHDYMMKLKYNPEIDWIRDVEEFIQIIWTIRTGLVSVNRPKTTGRENKFLPYMNDLYKILEDKR